MDPAFAVSRAPLANAEIVTIDRALPELRRGYPGTQFTGALFGKKLAAFFGGADVFVFPSVTDTYGLVLLEAMANACPIVASASGAVPT